MGMLSRAEPSLGSPAEEVWDLLRSLFAQQRRRFLLAASELDLHPAQAGTLLQLGAPVPMKELAIRLVCDNSNVTGLIDRLEGRELVTRESSSHDRRVKLVVLTEAGQRLRAELLGRIGQPPHDLDHLSAAEQRQLRDLLRRVLGDDTTPEAAGGR